MTQESSIEAQLTQLRQLYLKELPQRLNAILDIYHRLTPEKWSADDAAALHRLIHSLTGSAGTFGLHAISGLSREVEHQLQPYAKSALVPGDAEWLLFTQKTDQLHNLVVATLASDTDSASRPD